MRPGSRPLKELITFVTDRPGHDWRYAINTAKIERELGWRPRVDLEEGLRRTISWYLEHQEWLERVRSGAYRNYLQRQYGGAVV
jgi:dTDP-glucose 4,6-dehydratase